MKNDGAEELKHETADHQTYDADATQTQSVGNSHEQDAQNEKTLKSDASQTLEAETDNAQQNIETASLEFTEIQTHDVEEVQTLDTEKEQKNEAKDKMKQEDELQNDSGMYGNSVNEEAMQSSDDECNLELETDFQKDLNIEADSEDDDSQELETENDSFNEDDEITEVSEINEDHNTDNSQKIHVGDTSVKSRKHFSLSYAFVPLLLIAIILSCGVTLALRAFPAYTQKDAIEYYMSYLDFAMKQSVAESYHDYSIQKFYDLIYSTGDSAKYKVNRIIQKGDYTYVDVNVKYEDHTAAYNQTCDTVINSHENDHISDKELYTKMCNEFEQNLELEENSYSSTNLTFRCVKVGNCWMVDTYYLDADALANVLTGNVFEIFAGI